MIFDFQSRIDMAARWLNENVFSYQAMLQGWAFLQFALIVALYVFSELLHRWLEPRLEQRLRQIQNQPRLLRFLALLLRRIRWIAFAFTLWLSYAILRGVTWHSRSYFVGVAVSLVTAWLILSVGSRIIRNRTLAHTVAIVAWAAAALNILGLLGPAIELMQSLSFDIGEMHLSVWALVKGAILLTFLLWLAGAAGHLLDRRLSVNKDLTPSMQVLIGKIVKITLVAIAFFVALMAIGVNLTALAVFSGAVGLGLGFGLQKVVSNLVSGIIILLDKSIKPGDVITLGDTFGWITTLRSRYVSVVTRDGREYLIPNEDFVTQQVINWSFSSRNIRLEITFGVSYESDPHQVRETAIAATKTVERVARSPEPVCHVADFGDSSIDFVLRFWIQDPERGVANVRGQVFLALWDAFKEAGIAIPFPHREIIMRTPVELRRAPPQPE
ncbi:MAG: mechanosensitive ion channel [Hyphomicrobiales bacterium]|nr:mechanosensitive ion channel [Hyphomicrobiales bacterium]